MDGSVDKNTELRSSLLYFVDEAIGFRKSIHHFHRWLETNSQDEIEQLVIEIGNEHFVDFKSLILAIKNKDSKGIESSISRINDFGFFKSIDDKARLEELLETQASVYAIIDFLDEYLENITLLSCIIDNDITLLAEALGFYYPAHKKYIDQLVLAICNDPELNWKDALSRNQIKSKKWLLNKLALYQKTTKQTNAFMPKKTQTTVVVGGWVGILPFLASMNQVNLGKVLNVDVDTSVHSASMGLNSIFNPFYKTVNDDVRTLDFSTFSNPVVIDTIVEHFEDHDKWVKTLPTGTTVVLQGNNMFDVPDHVNCHSSLSQFVKSCGLSKIKWQGELVLYKCNRYMVIGIV